MRKLRLLLLVLVVLSFTACKESNSDSESTEEVLSDSGDETTDEYSDGTYCADIDYYNPDTGTRSTYTLNIEVEGHEVTVIQWPNGGWLDSTHFSPEELDSDGSCSISTYDGKQYDIQITGSECSFTDDRKVQEDKEEVECPECGSSKLSMDEYCYSCEKKFKCPECYGKKEKYEDLCSYCQRKIKDKEEHTCKRCGEHDSFMWSSDDLCSDCKRDDEDKEREEKRKREEEENN